MKISHIVNNLEAGGAQVFIHALATEQQKAGNEVFIVIIDQKKNERFEKDILEKFDKAGIKVFFLDRRLGINLSVIRSMRKLSGIMKNEKPDIINSHLTLSHILTAIFLKFIGRSGKINHVMTVHNAPETWNMQMTLLNTKTPTIYCSQAAKTTNVQRDCLNEVIENGILKQEADDSANKLLDGLKNKNKNKFVLSVGRLVAQKNYSLLIEIAKKQFDEQVGFLVCGDKGDTYQNDIKGFDEAGNIYYLGVLKPNEIISLMSKADCFLNTSLHEGLPITVLEAFDAGLPCVLAPILPHYEIGTEMPYCFIPDSFAPESFQKCLTRALDLNIGKQQIKKEREKEFAKYSIANTATKYVGFYNKIIKINKN